MARRSWFQQDSAPIEILRHALIGGREWDRRGRPVRAAALEAATEPHQCITPLLQTLFVPHTFVNDYTEMLLIVDNDVAFLHAAERVLNVRSGVLLARNAEQALWLLGSVGAALSVALVNAALLAHDGQPLIEQMGREYPNLPVIAITGSMREQVRERAQDFWAAGTDKKPITPELDAAIARARAKVANGS